LVDPLIVVKQLAFSGTASALQVRNSPEATMVFSCIMLYPFPGFSLRKYEFKFPKPSTDPPLVEHPEKKKQLS